MNILGFISNSLTTSGSYVDLPDVPSTFNQVALRDLAVADDGTVTFDTANITGAEITTALTTQEVFLTLGDNLPALDDDTKRGTFESTVKSLITTLGVTGLAVRSNVFEAETGVSPETDSSNVSVLNYITALINIFTDSTMSGKKLILCPLYQNIVASRKKEADDTATVEMTYDGQVGSYLPLIFKLTDASVSFQTFILFSGDGIQQIIGSDGKNHKLGFDETVYRGLELAAEGYTTVDDYAFAGIGWDNIGFGLTTRTENEYGYLGVDGAKRVVALAQTLSKTIDGYAQSSLNYAVSDSYASAVSAHEALGGNYLPIDDMDDDSEVEHIIDVRVDIDKPDYSSVADRVVLDNANVTKFRMTLFDNDKIFNLSSVSKVTLKFMFADGRVEDHEAEISDRLDGVVKFSVNTPKDFFVDKGRVKVNMVVERTIGELKRHVRGFRFYTTGIFR